MKKIILLSLIASASLFATDKNIEIGVGYVQDNLSGDIGVNGTLFDYQLSDSDGSDSDRFFAYTEIYNSIPFLPNLRLEYDNPSYSNGNVNLDLYTKLGDFSATSVGSYGMDLEEYTGILYYDVADMFMSNNFSFDMGVGVKYFDYKIIATDTGNNVTFYNESDSFAIPIIYLQPEYTIADVTLSATFEGLGYDGNNFYEAKAGIKYFFDSSFGDIGLEVGYAYSKLETNDEDQLIDDLSLDIEKSGFYGALIYRW